MDRADRPHVVHAHGPNGAPHTHVRVGGTWLGDHHHHGSLAHAHRASPRADDRGDSVAIPSGDAARREPAAASICDGLARNHVAPAASPSWSDTTGDGSTAAASTTLWSPVRTPRLDPTPRASAYAGPRVAALPARCGVPRSRPLSGDNTGPPDGPGILRLRI